MIRTDPTILAFDTSAAHCAAALLMNGEIVAARFEEMKKGQAERLFPMLEEMLAKAKITWKDLDAIGVCVGPGNFTGLRIAVSAARGLALSLGIPAIGVSLFETTRELATWAQVAVPGTRETFYFMDFDKMHEPVMAVGSDLQAVAYSSEQAPEAHVACITRIAALRMAKGEDIPSPAPLYVRPPDAAPASDPPPVILP